MVAPSGCDPPTLSSYIFNSVEEPDFFHNQSFPSHVARAFAAEVTRANQDDDDEQQHIVNVTNVEEEAPTPINLDENFSAYLQTSVANIPEQGVARMMPIETSYEPEPSLTDYVERMMERRLSSFIDTIRKEKKLPLKSDPNERDSSMAYLKDPPLTSLTTSPILKITKTVKSEGAEPNLPQLDNDNGNTSSSSQSAQEPEKKRTAAAIVRDMNKVTTMSTFPILQYDADTLKRQNGFQLYIRALQNVLMIIHELSNVLIQFPTIQSVTDDNA
jgi:hypothetical protein